MRPLRVVGLEEDGKIVILESDRGERYQVPADERLRAAARGDITRLGQIAIELESQMRPREIQSRIRAGESVEQVAAAAGVPPEKVERFAYPVLLERSRTAELAQRAHPVREDGPDVQELGEVVAQAFAARGQDYLAAVWDSWKGEDGKWVVQLTWTAGRSNNHAHWSFHPGAHGGTVTPLDDHALDLLDPNPNRQLRTVRPVTELAAQALQVTEVRRQAVNGGEPPRRVDETRRVEEQDYVQDFELTDDAGEQQQLPVDDPYRYSRPPEPYRPIPERYYQDEPRYRPDDYYEDRYRQPRYQPEPRYTPAEQDRYPEPPYHTDRRRHEDDREIATRRTDVTRPSRDDREPTRPSDHHPEPTRDDLTTRESTASRDDRPTDREPTRDRSTSRDRQTSTHHDEPATHRDDRLTSRDAQATPTRRADPESTHADRNAAHRDDYDSVVRDNRPTDPADHRSTSRHPDDLTTREPTRADRAAAHLTDREPIRDHQATTHRDDHDYQTSAHHDEPAANRESGRNARDHQTSTHHDEPATNRDDRLTSRDARDGQAATRHPEPVDRAAATRDDHEPAPDDQPAEVNPAQADRGRRHTESVNAPDRDTRQARPGRTRRPADDPAAETPPPSPPATEPVKTRASRPTKPASPEEPAAAAAATAPTPAAASTASPAATPAGPAAEEEPGQQAMPTTDEKEPPAKAEPTPPPAPAPPKKKGRKARPSVPSWEDVLLGTRSNR